MARVTRNEQLLIDFHAAKQAVRDAERERDRLKELVEALEVGAYGKWEKTYGEARQILDQSAVRDLCDEIGREVPMLESKPPLIVRPRVAAHR
jgi:hypothetical protein